MKTKIFPLFAAITVAAGALCGPILVGQPSWWDERNVLTNDPPDDYAVINQGQLKHLAEQAYEEFAAELPDGASDAIENLVSGWQDSSSADDYATANLGQLKQVAKPFYDQLIAVGYLTGYPWQEAGAAPDDYALANIGQAKYLFNFQTDEIATWATAFITWLDDWFETPEAHQADDPSPGDPNVTLRQAFIEGRNPHGETKDGPGDIENVEMEIFLPG